MSEINRTLTISLSNCLNNIKQNELRALFRPLTLDADTLRESDISETERQLNTLYQSQSEQFKLTANTCQKELSLIGKLTGAWLTKVNTKNCPCSCSVGIEVSKPSGSTRSVKSYTL